jgi:hypothetical protein
MEQSSPEKTRVTSLEGLSVADLMVIGSEIEALRRRTVQGEIGDI